MNEQWKPINGYEDCYMVSNLGRVKSLSRINAAGNLIKERILRPGIKKNGYLEVVLSAGNKKQFKIHRLVAMAFIPNPDNLPQVNHKNEIKSDNRVENLEWCSAQYNVNYGNGILKYKEARKRPVCQITKSGVIVAVYNTAYEASQKTKIDNSSICKSIKNIPGYEYVGGFKWTLLKPKNTTI